MRKLFIASSRNHITFALTLLIAAYVFSSSCHRIQDDKKIPDKMPTILVNLLKTDDPISYAKAHGIRLKDGMVRVIITVDSVEISRDFPSKHGIEDYQWRDNLVTGYISIDGLRNLSIDPSVIYIRLPASFMVGDDLNKSAE